MNRFIDHLQVVTTNNYNTIAEFHTTNNSTLSLLSLLGDSSPQWLFLCTVFTRHFLVKNLSNGDSSASVASRLTLHIWTINCTALTHWTELGQSSHIVSERTHRERRLHHLFYCCATSPLTWHVTLLCVYGPLPSNGCFSTSTVFALSKYVTVCVRFQRNIPFLLNFFYERRSQIFAAFNDFSEAHFIWLTHEVCEFLFYARYRLDNFRWANWCKKHEAFARNLHFCLSHSSVSET
jgi:hypothetical protein